MRTGEILAIGLARRRRERALIFALVFGTGVTHGSLAAGEIRFTPQAITVAADGATSVFAADVDGDGDTDVLSASANDSKIAWYENTNGDGSDWHPHEITRAALKAQSVFAADVDGDGDTDVLSASQDDHKIAWYENTNGDGSDWDPHEITRAAPNARSVFAADVDGDGDTDVLSAAATDDQIAWYENTSGDGSDWDPHEITLPANGVVSVYAADVDGDGDLDVLSASGGDDTIAWYENTNGDGSDWNPDTITTAVDGATSVYAADVDGDGDTDTLSASRNDDKIAWYENTNGDGSAWLPREITTAANDARSVYAADVDGDGDTDTLSASANDDKIAWYENTNGDGSAWLPHEITTAANDARSVYAADMDGDGDTDVLSASRIDDKIVWYENQTLHRSAVFPEETPISTIANGARAVTVADMDGDGDTDVLSASANDDKIAWHENLNADGSLWNEHTIGTVDFPRSVSAVDLDRDGDVDVLAASSHPATLGSSIAWYPNGGDGTFSMPQSITTALTGAASAHAVDVDRDGDLDVLSASGGHDTIAWYENVDGMGTSWVPSPISTTADGAISVYSIDPNGDGFVDVLSASFNDDTIAWHENLNGVGSSWLERTISTTADGASSVVAVDLDRDGDADVVSASFNNDTISWHENGNGFGTVWIEHTISTTADGARSAYAMDMDGDGDLDVVSASFNDDVVAWYENSSGDGSLWTTHLLSTTANGAQSVSAGDVDGDGDIDILSAAFNGDTIAWYENRGGGQFALPTTPVAQGVLFDSQEDVLFQIDLEHRGRTGDGALELATIELTLDDGLGIPLNATAANGLIDRLELFLDDGSRAFEAGADTLVEAIVSLDPSPEGFLTISLMSGDPDVLLDFGPSKRFFVVVTMTGNATAQNPDTFRVEHLTDSLAVTSAGRDALLPAISLTLEHQANISTGPIDTDLDSTTCQAPFDLDLEGFTVTAIVVCEAGTALRAGAGLTVSSAGDLSLRAGQWIELQSGFSVETGGKLVVEIDPSLEP